MRNMIIEYKESLLSKVFILWRNLNDDLDGLKQEFFRYYSEEGKRIIEEKIKLKEDLNVFLLLKDLSFIKSLIDLYKHANYFI